MSLGGNFSSGHTNTLTEKTVSCALPKFSQTMNCSSQIQQHAARYPSMVICSKACPPPSPADFAKYPKVAVPSSTRTQALANASQCASIPNPQTRFSHYQRFQIPVPCAPLPASANMAGISQPSSRPCNL